jgi:hypothetical protein
MIIKTVTHLEYIATINMYEYKSSLKIQNAESTALKS